MRKSAMFIVLAPAMSLGTAFGECPDAMNPCEQESASPGCSDQACCEAVCAVDGFCCEVAWDAICVGETFSLCNIPLDVCGRSDHGCFTLGEPGCSDTACCEMVCEMSGLCCISQWDVDCVSLAITLCGSSACGNADHSCDTVGGPGCSSALCCSTVCAALPECCDVAWDEQCVAAAATMCQSTCGTSSHDCCTTGGPGCSDATCCELVCADDLDCCEIEWDQQCVKLSFVHCSVPSAGFGCTTCNHGCLETGLPGCGDIACCDLVCRVDCFCCAVFWDSFCIAEAAEVCYPAGDLNGDGSVDGADLGLLLSVWGPCSPPLAGCIADLDNDNMVNGADLGILLNAWTASPD